MREHGTVLKHKNNIKCKIEHLIEEGSIAERAEKLRHHAAWLLKTDKGIVYGPSKPGIAP